MSEYNWTEVSMPIHFSEDRGMRISRMIWFWQRRSFVQRGWTVDGGLWPRLRVTRPMKLKDYIYSRPSALQKLIDTELYSDGSYGGIDRSAPTLWKTNGSA